jgi:hypothetical protein
MALERLRPGRYTLIATNDGVRLHGWPDDVPLPDSEVIRTTIAAIQQERETERLARAAERARLLALAQSAVGVRVDLASANQKWAIVALLMWQLGVLDSSGKIRPLAEWLSPVTDASADEVLPGGDTPPSPTVTPRIEPTITPTVTRR